MVTKRKISLELINKHSDKIFPAQFYRYLAEKTIQTEDIALAILRIIAVDDKYLRALHRSYLQQDTYTDVMTFQLEEGKKGEAEIYISLDRAKINAEKFHVTVKEEVARLIIHGLLHLKGMTDETEQERQRMHERENDLLKKFWQPDTDYSGGTTNRRQ
jgi:probable rRNA maturation factor